MEINKTKLIELLEDDYQVGYWEGEEHDSKFVNEGIFLMRDNYDHLIDLIKKCVGETSDESAALPLHDVSNNEALESSSEGVALNAEVFKLANKLAIAGYGDEAVKMHDICNGMK